MNWELKINFSTWIQEGLILWQGNQIQENLFDEDDSSNYIALGIRNSRMLFISNGIELSVNQVIRQLSVGICKYKPGYKSHDQSKKTPLQDFLSILNAVISTNESPEFTTGHVIYNLAYT